jgi:hypothetical protein
VTTEKKHEESCLFVWHVVGKFTKKFCERQSESGVARTSTANIDRRNFTLSWWWWRLGKSTQSTKNYVAAMDAHSFLWLVVLMFIGVCLICLQLRDDVVEQDCLMEVEREPREAKSSK